MEQGMQSGKKCIKSRLSVCGVGIAAGITWGLGVFLIALASMYYDWGTPWVDLLASMYKGYAATWQGSFIGLGWAFLDGLVCGLVFAIIYNIVARCCPCPMCKSKREG